MTHPASSRFIPSDDGRYALVEFVARDRLAFTAILADTNPEIKNFEHGRNSKDRIETVSKQYRRDFDISKFAAHIH